MLPSLVRLRREMENSRCRKSSTNETKPEHTELCTNKKNPRCTESKTGKRKPSHIRLCSGTLKLKCVRSKAKSAESIQHKPITGKLEPG